jgi:plasmid stabilization system protein ParE
MNRFSVSPAARADLRGIWKYIARDNQNAANRLRGRLQEAFLMLGQNPLLGQACDELLAASYAACVSFSACASRSAEICPSSLTSSNRTETCFDTPDSCIVTP